MNINCMFVASIVLSWQLLGWQIALQQDLMALSHRLASSLLGHLPALSALHHTFPNLILRTIRALIASGSEYMALAAIFNLRTQTLMLFPRWNEPLNPFTIQLGKIVPYFYPFTSAHTFWVFFVTLFHRYIYIYCALLSYVFSYTLAVYKQWQIPLDCIQLEKKYEILPILVCDFCVD